jgi:3-keto-disaccharide hydrolase
MTRSVLVSSLLAIGLAACSSPSDDAPRTAAMPGEWDTLFDGTNLDRFERIGDANWQIVNDYVRADSGSGYLVSDADYDNFDLSLEFWVDVEANSGVFLRCQDRTDVRDTNCYEVNIFDTRPDQTYRSGGIVHFAAPAAVVNTGGRWNAYEITADGPHLVVTLNGVKTVDVDDETYASGPIALQYGAGTVIFRNVRIRRH